MNDKLKQANQNLDQLAHQKSAVAQSGIEKINSLDRQIRIIQSSTKTTFGFFIPLHNNLRMRYSWYYHWHLSQYANKLHITLFWLIVAIALVYFIN